MLPPAVLDSSCALALESTGVLPALSMLFSKVYLPVAVRTEIRRRRTTRRRLRRLQSDNVLFVPCNQYDPSAVELMLPPDRSRVNKDRGEAETALQASEMEAMALIDDRWGRDLARRMDIEVHGSLWVIERLHALGILTPAAVRAAFQQMLNAGHHLPFERVNEILIELGEAQLL